MCRACDARARVQESPVEWASRWDAYLRMPNGSVHWFSILNSLLVVLVMSVIVAVILMRTVRRDLAKYEELLVEAPEGGSKDEGGWKFVSGDVFRAPARADSLAVQARAVFSPSARRGCCPSATRGYAMVLAPGMRRAAVRSPVTQRRLLPYIDFHGSPS